MHIQIKKIYDLPQVKVRSKFDFENALKRFKRRVREAGIIPILKNRKYHPTGKMRKKHKRRVAMKRKLIGYS